MGSESKTKTRKNVIDYIKSEYNVIYFSLYKIKYILFMIFWLVGRFLCFITQNHDELGPVRAIASQIEMQLFVPLIVIFFYQQIAINDFLLFTTQLNP